jgi:hypothetical protein
MSAFLNLRNLGLFLLSLSLFFSLIFAQTSEVPKDAEAPQPCLVKPDIENLSLAFDTEIASFLELEQEAYAEVYANLSYDYIPLVSLEGTTGRVEANYTGSVTDISTGEAISATGIIYATFGWDACHWQLLDYSF